DLDNQQASHAFTDALNKTNVLTIRAIPASADFSQYIRDHSINVALLIPEGFQQALSRAENGTRADVNLTLAGDQTQSSYGIALLFASVALMVLTGIVIFGLKAVVTPMAILIIIAGTLEFTSLGMVLGIFVRDPETGAAIANAIGFPMMFLAGSFFPVDAMPSFLQTGARLLPLTYINEGLRATMTFGTDATALIDLLVTLGFAVVFFVVAARGLS